MWTVVEVSENRSEICDRILRTLPKWFGIESSIVEYVRAVAKMPMLAVLDRSESAIAFVSINFHNEHNAEIHVMAVLPEFHGRGLGKALVEAAERFAIESGRKFLTVKTLSPSRPNPEYDLTRRFYIAAGFVPLEEFPTLWGEHNPCLLMIKTLADTRSLFPSMLK